MEFFCLGTEKTDSRQKSVKVPLESLDSLNCRTHSHSLTQFKKDTLQPATLIKMRKLFYDLGEHKEFIKNSPVLNNEISISFFQLISFLTWMMRHLREKKIKINK